MVFTDDDITPNEDWLKAIISISKRWPDHDVFGGKIDIIWPAENIPGWAKISWIKNFGFAHHDQGDSDKLYPQKNYPFGPNFWIRRKVLNEKRRFNEFIGPRPKNRIIGGETTFLKELKNEGFKMIYSPDAVVSHRIQREMLTLSYIFKRAYAFGRGLVHISGVEDNKILNRYPILWYTLRLSTFVKIFLYFVRALLSCSHDRRIDRCIYAFKLLGTNIESLTVTAKK